MLSVYINFPKSQGSLTEAGLWLNSMNDLSHLLRHPDKYVHGHALNQTEELIQPNNHFWRQGFSFDLV